MLIYLQPALAAQFPQLHQEPLFLDAMQNLALSVREGKHVLAGPYPVLRALLEWTDLPSRERKVFEDCYAQIQTLHALASRTLVRVEVGATKGVPITRKDTIAQWRFVVPYDYFADSQRIQPVRLIGENNADAELYKRGAQVIHAQSGIPAGSGTVKDNPNPFVVRLNTRGGGGSQLAQEMQKAAQSEMVLGVADGDIRYPQGQPANHTTQMNARNVVSENAERAVIELLVTHGRAAENLLPDAAILAALYSDAPAGERKKLLSAEQRNLLEDQDARQHLDLRAGLKLWEQKKKNQADKPQDEQDFLASVRAKHVAEARFSGSCLTECQKKSKKECCCFGIDGLGKDLLSNAVKHLKSTPEAEIVLTPELSRIAKYVAAFGYASKPLRGSSSIWT